MSLKWFLKIKNLLINQIFSTYKKAKKKSTDIILIHTISPSPGFQTLYFKEVFVLVSRGRETVTWPTHNDSGYEYQNTMQSSVTPRAYSQRAHMRKRWNAQKAEP